MISSHQTLQNLADASWQNAIPQIDPKAQDDLAKLKEITSIVQKSLGNEQDLSTAKKVAGKCWNFATHMKDPQQARVACQICYENLADVADEPQTQDNRKTFELVVGDKTFTMPGYYKKLLANASPYFKALFEDEFSEKQSGAFKITEVSPQNFEILLKLFNGEALEMKELDLNDLVDLLITADRLELEGGELITWLADTIKGLEPTPENDQIIQDIRSRLYQTIFLEDHEVMNATQSYDNKSTDGLKSFEDWLAYTQKNGQNMRTLSSIRNLSFTGPELTQLVKNCPNLSYVAINCHELTDKDLESLKGLKNLTGLALLYCNQMTDEALAALKESKDLRRLIIHGNNGMTGSGFEYLKELPNLRSLLIHYSARVTGKGFEYLKEVPRLSELQLHTLDRLKDEDCDHLRSLTQLKKIVIQSCSQVSKEEINKLQEAMPETKIFLY